MNLRAGATGTRVAHLPEVVVLVTVDDMVSRHMLQPVAGSLIIAFQSLFLRTFKDSDVEVFWVEFEHINKIFPCHVDGTLFEVVAKAPVAQHLKHGVVIGVVPHLL